MTFFLHLFISFQLVFFPYAEAAEELNNNKQKMMNQVLFYGAAATAVGTAVTCPNLMIQPSVITFFTTGLTYLLKEKHDKKKSEEEREKLQTIDQNDKDYQIKSQELLFKDKSLTHDYARKKLENLKIAKIGFSLAASLAVAEIFIPWLGGVGCLHTPNPMEVLTKIGLGIVPSFVLGMTAQMMKTRVTRAIYFAGLVVLSSLVSKEINERKTELLDKMKNLSKYIKELKKQSSGGPVYDLNPDSTVTDDFIENFSLTEGEGFSEEDFPDSMQAACVENSSYEVKTKSCQRKLSFNSFNQMANTKIADPTLKKSFSDLMGYAEAVTTGDQKSAKSYAAALLKDAPEIEKVKEKLKKQVNDQLVLQGKPKIDFEKRTQEILDDMYKAQGLDPSTMGSGASFVQGADKGPSLSDMPLNVPRKTIETNQQPLSSFEEDDTHLSEQSSAQKELQNELLGEGNVELSGQDDGVSKNVTGKIFEQISQRYILNYPKLFDQKSEATHVEK